MFSELAGSGSRLFCQNKDDVTALPVSLCPNFSFLSSFHLPFSFHIRDIISEILSSCIFCQNQKVTLLEPTLEEWPVITYTAPRCFSHLLLFVQWFSALCAIERPNTSVASEMGWDTGKAWRDCWMQEVELCSRKWYCSRSGASGKVLQWRTGNTSRWVEDLYNRCEYGSLSWNPENKTLPMILTHLLSL